ncbi:MAG: hypothetical protein CM1200mP16_03800 [Nitrospina sp.]|nr:MAG: hypothetical protein CM1200mP16_03800 [Nitrospina sp.]
MWLIYESDLEMGIKDTDGNLILSEWVAINMKALIKGGNLRRGYL